MANKTLTMSQLRAEPGEVLREVWKDGLTLRLMRNGRHVADIEPPDTVIESNGKVRGPLPVTHRRHLGNKY